MNIIGKRYWFFLLSAIIIIPGIISLAVSGLKYGIDFKSGTNLTMHFVPNVEESKLREGLTNLGYGNAEVQQMATGDFLVRVQEVSTDERQRLTAGLGTALSSNVTIPDYPFSPPVVSG